MPHPDEPKVYLDQDGNVVTADGLRPMWKTKKGEFFLEELDRRHIINAMNHLRRSHMDTVNLFWLANMRHVYYVKTAARNERRKLDA